MPTENKLRCVTRGDLKDMESLRNTLLSWKKC